VPEVGLEPDSSPCQHWAHPEHPDPTAVRPSPKPKVCTLCTPLLTCGGSAERDKNLVTESPLSAFDDGRHWMGDSPTWRQEMASYRSRSSPRQNKVSTLGAGPAADEVEDKDDHGNNQKQVN
jgi:hypothetical protein